MHVELTKAAADAGTTCQADGNCAIRLEGLTKTFGAHVATRDVNLAVYAGEFVTLLGPSGSGKTTTLMMVAGHETPNSGRIFVNGYDVTHQPPHLRRRSEEHTSELQSLMRISYAVFCLKQKN